MEMAKKKYCVFRKRPLIMHFFEVVDGGSDDESYSDEESPKKRRDILTRRPSYRKILNDLGGGEIGNILLFTLFSVQIRKTILMVKSRKIINI